MQVDVIGRIPKRDRRWCNPRAHTGLRVEAPEDLVDRYPDCLVPVVEKIAGEIAAADDQIREAAITSDVVPKPSPQPIKPTRRRRPTKPKKV